MKPTDEFELPLTIKRSRCANGETMEWQLKLGRTTIVTRFRNMREAPEMAVRDLVRAAYDGPLRRVEDARALADRVGREQ